MSDPTEDEQLMDRYLDATRAWHRHQEGIEASSPPDTISEPIPWHARELGRPSRRAADYVSRFVIDPAIKGLKDPTVQRILIETGAGLLPVVGPVSRAPLIGAKAPLLGRMVAEGIAAAFGSFAAEGVDPSTDPLQTALTTAAFGAGSQAVLYPFEKMMRPLFNPSPRLRPNAEEAIEFLAERGATAPPASFTGSTAVNRLESVAESSFLGGSIVSDTRAFAGDIVEAALRDLGALLPKTNIDRMALGEMLQDTLEGGVDLFNLEARRIFSVVDDVTARGPLVAGASIADAIRGQLDILSVGLSSAAPGARKILNESLAKVVDANGNIINLTFAQAQALRSDLLSIGRSALDLSPKKALQMARTTAKAVGEEMRTAARGLGRQALVRWENANKFWTEGLDEFNSKLITGMLRSDPEMVYGLAVKNQSPSTIRRLRNIVVKSDPKFDPARSMITQAAENVQWQQVQGRFLLDIFQQATDANTGKMSGAKLRRLLEDFGSVGDQGGGATGTLVELFPVGNVALGGVGNPGSLMRLARSLEVIQSESIDRTGSVFIQLTQAGAVGGLLVSLTGGGTSALTAGTAAILLGPPILAKMFTNPKVVRALTIGLKAPRGSLQGARAAAVISAFLVDEGLQDPFSAPQGRLGPQDVQQGMESIGLQ